VGNRVYPNREGVVNGVDDVNKRDNGIKMVPIECYTATGVLSVAKAELMLNLLKEEEMDTR
jgi:hypothetical protein